MAEVTLTWDEVLGWRVRRHRLDRPLADAATLVAELAGVQAQVQSSAERSRCVARPISTSTGCCGTTAHW